MKAVFSWIIICVLAATVNAQSIKIMPGTNLNIGGNHIQLTLADGMSFENNTDIDLQVPALNISVYGTGTSEFRGSGKLLIGNLDVRKTSGTLRLEKDLTVSSEVNFNNGLLQLNGHTLRLTASSRLLDEVNYSRISGSTGAVEIQVNIPASGTINPGNLGLTITATSAVPNVVIRRTHGIQTNGIGGSSIARSYEVITPGNTPFNATVQFSYFDEELNALDENRLELYQSAKAGQGWISKGSSSRNPASNFVSAANMNFPGLYTLSTINNPLPVKFSAIGITCLNNQPKLQWKVANPQDVHHFRIEKSNDGRTWEWLPAQVTPVASPLHEYTFTDNIAPAAFYRLEATEYNGIVTLTPVLKGDCHRNSNEYSLVTNPVRSDVQLNISSAASGKMLVQVFDMHARLLATTPLSVNAGNSIHNIGLPAIPAGTYLLKVSERNQTRWTSLFLKK